eukprot:5848795-Pyramimonas_sp.AAC.1
MFGSAVSRAGIERPGGLSQETLRAASWGAGCWGTLAQCWGNLAKSLVLLRTAAGSWRAASIGRSARAPRRNLRTFSLAEAPPSPPASPL